MENQDSKSVMMDLFTFRKWLTEIKGRIRRCQTRIDSLTSMSFFFKKSRRTRSWYTRTNDSFLGKTRGQKSIDVMYLTGP